MANNDEEATKKDFVEAYFEELERKIAFLRDLEAQGHEDEAQLLALVYLDGLSNWLRHPSDGAARNFSSVVIEHGQDAQFPLIIVHWLVNALPWKSAPSGAEHAIRKALAAMDEYAAQTRDELLGALRVGLTANQLSWLEAEIWRGSVANAAYVSLRSPGIHQLATHGLSFSESTWQGIVLERVGLERLLRAFEAIVMTALFTKVVARHQVTPGECEQVFFHEPLLIAPDPRHSKVEERWAAWGRTAEGRTLAIVFTLRGDRIRPLSAREMNRKERQRYAETQA